MPRTRSIAWSELKLGVVGLTALLLVGLIIVAVGGQGGFWWQRYPLKMQFADARGLKPGAVARVNGKEVGRATSVEFSGTRIDVVIELNKDVRPLVTTEAVGTLGSLSLLGESMVDIRANPGGTPLGDWQYIKTAEVTQIGDLTTSASQGLESAGQLLADVRAGKGTLGKLVTDEALYRELNQLVASAQLVTKNLNQGRGTIGTLMQDPAAANALKASLEELQTITTRLNSGQGALGRFLNDEAMSKSIGNTFSNLEQTTGRMGKGDNTLGKLLTEKELYDRLNSMAGQLDQVTAGLREGRGTMGLLLRDQQLYENMNRTVTEIRDLVADIRKDPKKYLRVNVSIF